MNIDLNFKIWVEAQVMTPGPLDQTAPWNPSTAQTAAYANNKASDIDPDTIFAFYNHTAGPLKIEINPPAYTFGYNGKRGLIISPPQYRPTAGGGKIIVKHSTMGFDHNTDLETTLLGRAGLVGDSNKAIEAYKQGAIQDYFDSLPYVVAFWNSPKEVFDAYLKPCLQMLQRRRVFPNEHNIIVASPFGQNSLETHLAASQPQTYNQQRSDELEKKRQMHTMTPSEKAQAWQSIGGRPYIPPKYQNPRPGTKWWAATSESRDER